MDVLRVRADVDTHRVVPAQEFRWQFLYLGDEFLSDRWLYGGLPRGRRRKQGRDSGYKPLRSAFYRRESGVWAWDAISALSRRLLSEHQPGHLEPSHPMSLLGQMRRYKPTGYSLSGEQ